MEFPRLTWSSLWQGSVVILAHEAAALTLGTWCRRARELNRKMCGSAHSGAAPDVVRDAAGSCEAFLEAARAGLLTKVCKDLLQLDLASHQVISQCLSKR